MPNGFHGKPADWQRLTEPLLRLDPALESFAAANRLPLTKNSRNWPSRELRWSDSLDRLIQISLEDEALLTWSLSICASEDRHDGRYWTCASILENMSIDTLENELPELMNRAFEMVLSWNASELEKAGGAASDVKWPWTRRL